ncbi:hypothetical protein BJS_05801 [Bradyrhizobium japonicum SEMIA 5079]|uniref:Uncharacterized protein n=1 Tax=Bradyrhizobium diazoefficiens SEMIA 5080 TaxID=754504 RepID=A0A837C5Z7_9BRAD|nr:hypothetical protein BJS_05801 [Bradyrhizobium japonicum SEMIA 5079]KGJ64435.1 hypothetical protein BJA5080_07135 [Bradyrhizobium diazoefficiens SEMIA 5080]
MDLARCLHLGKLGEHECERLLNAPIRVLVDPIVGDLEIADGDVEEELTPACLLLQGFKRALPNDRQLHLAHRAFHASRRRSLGWRGSSTPSSSTISVPTSP